jgi:hypothetical protein
MVDNSPNRFFLQHDQSSPSPILGARRTGIAPRNHHPPRPLAQLARPSLFPPTGFRVQVFWPVRGLLRSWAWATVASRVSLRACEGYRSCTKKSQQIATYFKQKPTYHSVSAFGSSTGTLTGMSGMFMVSVVTRGCRRSKQAVSLPQYVDGYGGAEI